MGDETPGTKATKALGIADRIADRLTDMRKHFDERFDRIDKAIDKSDERVSDLSTDLNDLKTKVAVLQDRWKWIAGIAGLGGAGGTMLAQELVNRAGPLVGQ